MKKYVTATLYCGLLLSSGSSYSANTDLLEQLSNEKIIGNDTTSPFSSTEGSAAVPESPPIKTAPRPAKPQAKPLPVA